MACACPTNNNRNPQDSRPCCQIAGATSPMRKFRATPSVVHTAGMAALFVLVAVHSRGAVLECRPRPGARAVC